MANKKYSRLLAVLVLMVTILAPLSGALAASAGDAGTADERVEAGDRATITAGRYSALLFSAPRSGIVRLARGAKIDHKTGKIGLREDYKFVQELWKIGYVDQDDKLVEGYSGLAQLSVGLTKESRHLWDKGELSFYTYDGNSWSECNARLITAGANGALVCDTRGVGRFGLVDVVSDKDD